MTKKFFIIAGEASGDLLGGKLIEEIKSQFASKNEAVEFVGVGGKLMQQQGLKSIFPLEELSVMGFVEVLPHLAKLLKRIKQTADEIRAQKPDFVITIDSPDFNFRVMQKIRDFKSCKKIHLIAPSVWAYRKKRAQKIAQLYDLLLAILPFEPPYFLKYNLKTVFVGHPIVENAPNMALKKEAATHFRQKYGFYATDTVVLITPGSRIGEVKKIFPHFIAAINLLKEKIPNLSVVLTSLDKTAPVVERMSKNFDVKYVIVPQEEKQNALFAADFALAKSGTNTLEASLYGLPMLVCYKVNAMTYAAAKMLLKIKFANLINLIMQREIIPELIQQNCTAEKIASRLEQLVANKNEAYLQIEDSVAALRILGLDADEKPTKKAVREILAL